MRDENLKDDNWWSEAENEKKPRNYKVLTVAGVVVLLFFALISRLYILQVSNDSTYNAISDRNRMRTLTTTAPRGNIYDANYTELAISKPVFAISVAATEIAADDREAFAQALAPILADEEITVESLVSTLAAHSSTFRTYEPVIIKRYSYDEGLQIITQLEEMREYFPAMMITEEPMRYYPLGSLAGHLIGTIGLLSESEMNLVEESNYQLNDWLGKSGLEKTMESFIVDGEEIGLRGTKGFQTVEVNVSSRPTRVLSSYDPIAGNSLVLTLDTNVQAVMEQALEEIVLKTQKAHPKSRVASAVLINVKTGGIIAMASYPGMDPNDFVNGLSKYRSDYYFQNDDRPMVNRAIAGAYPPGSTFKIATATAIMASDIVSERTTVTCSPAAWAKPRATCPYSHGVVSLNRALAVSCNAYFQEMAYRIGHENLIKTCEELGIGQLSGIDLPGEVKGVLPSPEWKKEYFPEDHWEYNWHNYNTFYMAMGQGYVTTTPLQLANYVATVANGGYHMQPYLVDKVVTQGDQDEEVIYQFQPVIKNQVEISQESLAAVRAGMRAVIQPGGTASSVFSGFPIAVAGKTGTAQTGLAGDDKNKDYHGVFVAFAPYEEPEVAFACIVEYGYRGGTSAGVVCRRVFEEYFNINPEPLPDDLPPSPE